MRSLDKITRVLFTGLCTVVAIGLGGISTANADVNLGSAGEVTDVSGSGGVNFVGACNYAIAAIGVNTNDVTYVAEGNTTADWPLASTGLRCAYHLSDGSVVAFERALPGSASAISGTFKAPLGGVQEVCYHATGVKLDNTSVESKWHCF